MLHLVTQDNFSLLTPIHLRIWVIPSLRYSNIIKISYHKLRKVKWNNLIGNCLLTMNLLALIVLFRSRPSHFHRVLKENRMEREEKWTSIVSVYLFFHSWFGIHKCIHIYIHTHYTMQPLTSITFFIWTPHIYKLSISSTKLLTCIHSNVI